MKKTLRLVLIVLVYAISKKYPLFTNDASTTLNSIDAESQQTNVLQKNATTDATKDATIQQRLLQKPNIAKLDTNVGWMAKVNEQIAAMEYHVTFDSITNSYQCPNRRNNIRAYFAPGTFTIKNRVDSIDHNWIGKLINEGIYADGHLLYAPQQDAYIYNNKNEISIQHCSFEEQYINTPEGVRQNFIIHEAPLQTNELEVKMTVEGLLVDKVNPVPS